jgi:hypothetical protein
MAFTQAHALVIGVGTHQFEPNLDVPITVDDAKAVAEVLVDDESCGYPAAQVALLGNEKASRSGILSALEGLSKSVKEQDTLFFFFCGHGVLGTDGNYYLVSHDAQLDNGKVVAGTGVGEKELISQLKTIQAKRVLMVFNACFSGKVSPTLAVKKKAFKARSLSEDLSNALLGTGEGRIIITACRENQESYVGAGPLTIFTQALVDGLRGKDVGNHNGYISAFSLYEHIFETVSETVKEVYAPAVQEPELTVLKGIGSFAVALYKGAVTLGDFNTDQPVPDLPAVRQVKPEKAQKALGLQINTGTIITIGGHATTGNVAGGNIITTK